MSLLAKPKMTTRWKKVLLVVVSILLLVPSVGAAAFNMRFDLEPVAAQDPKETERKEKVEMRAGQGPSAEMKERMANDPAFAKEMERRRELELEMRAITQAALVKLARIPMEQAIQVANSQQPGKVLLATLGAKGWEEPGKLGKDGVVFYHVQVADEVSGGVTHVFVNAIDGTLIKTEKELPRKQRSPEKQ